MEDLGLVLGVKAAPKTGSHVRALADGVRSKGAATTSYQLSRESDVPPSIAKTGGGGAGLRRAPRVSKAKPTLTEIKPAELGLTGRTVQDRSQEEPPQVNTRSAMPTLKTSVGSNAGVEADAEDAGSSSSRGGTPRVMGGFGAGKVVKGTTVVKDPPGVAAVPSPRTSFSGTLPSTASEEVVVDIKITAQKPLSQRAAEEQEQNVPPPAAANSGPEPGPGARAELKSPRKVLRSRGPPSPQPSTTPRPVFALVPQTPPDGPALPGPATPAGRREEAAVQGGGREAEAEACEASPAEAQQGALSCRLSGERGPSYSSVHKAELAAAKPNRPTSGRREVRGGDTSARERNPWSNALSRVVEQRVAEQGARRAAPRTSNEKLPAPAPAQPATPSPFNALSSWEAVDDLGMSVGILRRCLDDFNPSEAVQEAESEQDEDAEDGEGSTEYEDEASPSEAAPTEYTEASTESGDGGW